MLLVQPKTQAIPATKGDSFKQTPTRKEDIDSVSQFKTSPYFQAA
jgi:hypothetical protein